jgi:pimeloyl-ACP methyl ester carboxylesterase
MDQQTTAAAFRDGRAGAGVLAKGARENDVVVEEADADVNGTRLHYRIAGSGSAVLLLHGFGETGEMWRPLLADLARTHTVIVPDLRGAGASAKPEGGYEKTNLARDAHELVAWLGYQDAAVVGHDIGMMAAYAYAAQFPAATRKLVLMDAFLPGIGNWHDMFLLRDLWHFHFYGETPLRLVSGRERIYLEHFWNDFAADRNHSIPEGDRERYTAAYAQPGAIRAGFEYFKAFDQDAQEFAQLAQARLAMPVLVIAGEKSGGEFLVEQVRLAANQVTGAVVMGSGHWLMEEAPDEVMGLLADFIQ